MADKPYYEMSDAELHAELVKWETNVDEAGGWSSAYFAAKQVEAIVATGNRRGLGMVNRHPIKVMP